MPRHLFLQSPSETHEFTTPPQRGGNPTLPPRDRRSHAQYLENQLDAAWETWETQKTERTAMAVPSRTGCYLEVKGQAGYDLVLQSLEDLKQDIRLLHAHPEEDPPRALIHVPEGRQVVLLRKIRQYASEDTEGGNAKHRKLVEGIESIHLALLRSFWNDAAHLLPEESKTWIEVWLNVHGNPEIRDAQITGFIELLQQLEIEQRAGELLHFPERSILLLHVDQHDLTELVASSDIVAEFRSAKDTPSFWLDLEPYEQAEWATDLRSRLRLYSENNIFVCLLDTGANNGHLLIEPHLDDQDRFTVKEEWGVEDHHPHGHGTMMAGLAVYGDLSAILGSRNPVEIVHRLESVKLLPPPNHIETPRHLWGDFTRQAIYIAEARSPERKRIGCMAVASEDGRDRGLPTSWSGAIDQLSSEDPRRLIVLCAGNTDPASWRSYPVSNMTDSIHDPGQSWNALTVGAYTSKDSLTDPNLAEYRPLAPPGDLSPFSTTSLEWDRTRWPNKPDIVLEGGNLASMPDDPESVSECDDLSLLSVHSRPSERQFTDAAMTSAATALAAKMAAEIQNSYPGAWPETVRALMVHSAEWTDQMLHRFAPSRAKREYGYLLRICGYGVPNIRRAVESSRNTVVLVSQRDGFQPFDRKQNGKGYRTKDMDLYELPWPREVLQALPPETMVSMRVTLSYFVEPSPLGVGWKDRYRYASHALRFDVNGATESREQFIARINNEARPADGRQYPSDSHRWLIGKQNRDVGSLHGDVWSGTAADLAAGNLIAVYPVVGWWRERPHLRRWGSQTRYSLIVSLKTESSDVDIYTSIAAQIPVAVPID